MYLHILCLILSQIDLTNSKSFTFEAHQAIDFWVIVNMNFLQNEIKKYNQSVGGQKEM